MLIGIQKNSNIMLDLLSTVHRRRILIISEILLFVVQQVISPNVHERAQFHILKYDVRVFTRSTIYYCDYFCNNVNNNINVELSYK